MIKREFVPVVPKAHFLCLFARRNVNTRAIWLPEKCRREARVYRTSLVSTDNERASGIMILRKSGTALSWVLLWASKDVPPGVQGVGTTPLMINDAIH